MDRNRRDRQRTRLTLSYLPPPAAKALKFAAETMPASPTNRQRVRGLLESRGTAMILRFSDSRINGLGQQKLWSEWTTCCDGNPRSGRASRLGQLHQSSGWHRCVIGPTGRSHGSVPQRPALSGSGQACCGAVAPTGPMGHPAGLHLPANRRAICPADTACGARGAGVAAVFSIRERTPRRGPPSALAPCCAGLLPTCK